MEWSLLSNEPRAAKSREFQLTAGYPHLNLAINYDARDIPVAPRVVYGSPAGSTLTAREGFQVQPPLDYSPDGFSGAPVFSVFDRNGNWYLTLDGIATNASSSMFNYIPLPTVQTFLESL